MDASLAFVGSGAALGAVLGSSLLGSRKRGLSEEKVLALLLMAVSAAMVSITMQHGSSGLSRSNALPFVEYVTALCAGPLFAGYVRSRARGAFEFRPLYLLHFLPAALIGFQILATSSVVIPMRVVMLIQMVYTAISIRELVTARRRGIAMTEIRWPARFVVFAVLIHVAQAVRAIAFDVSALRNVVPVTAIAALEILAILAFRESILALPPQPKPRRDRVVDDDVPLLVSAIDAAMRHRRLWTDTNLNLDSLAKAVESTPHRVSNALNAERGGFFEYVTSFRLDAVREALEMRENDTYTIDSLVENAGFRSRSTFYAAFRRRFGVTPSEVRRRHEPCPPVEPYASRLASAGPEAPL